MYKRQESNFINTYGLFEELRLSQARRRGFESHHPLHKAKRRLAWGKEAKHKPILTCPHKGYHSLS